MVIRSLVVLLGHMKEAKLPSTRDFPRSAFITQSKNCTQTTFTIRTNIHFSSNCNHSGRELVPVNLGQVQEFIDMGRIHPPRNFFLTMRDLVQSGLIVDTKDGVKLLANGKDKLK
ncbi:ribosomal protein L15 family protein, partial [archaeon]